MTYRIENPVVGSQAIALNSTDQAHPLGLIVRANDEVYASGEFIYLQGVASTVLGSWVLYSEDDYTTVLLPTSAIGQIAVAMAATVAGEFGWYQITGKAIGKVAAGFVDGANVYATSTPGTVDDALVAGDRVQGAKGASAIGTPSTGLAELEISRPFGNDGLAG